MNGTTTTLLAGLLPCLTLPASSQMPPAAKDGAAAQDVLIFRNGDRLTGKLLRGAGESIVFHSDAVGDVTVPLAKVQELQTTGTFAVLQKKVPVSVSEKLEPERIHITEAGISVQPVNAPPPPVIPPAQVAYIVDGETYRKQLAHKPGPLEGWNGTVTVGATLEQSTQHGGTFTAGAALVRQVPLLTDLRTRNKTSVNVQETYGTLTTPVIPQTTPASPDVVVKTSIFHANVERDEYFSPKGYGLGDATFDHNYSQGLELQQTYGGGVGYTALATAVQNLQLKVDVHFQREEFFVASQNLNLIGSTFAETYRAQLPRKLVMTESASVAPAWNDLDAYAANGAIGFAMPVLKRLSVNLAATDSFLNNPSPGYQKNSLQLTTGLSYSLR